MVAMVLRMYVLPVELASLVRLVLGVPLPPPNRRTNREKVADLKRQGMSQKDVVRELGISKSRVSQLWPRTAEVQAVLAEEHAAEVREALAQRRFADIDMRASAKIVNLR